MFHLTAGTKTHVQDKREIRKWAAISFLTLRASTIHASASSNKNAFALQKGNKETRDKVALNLMNLARFVFHPTTRTETHVKEERKKRKVVALSYVILRASTICASVSWNTNACALRETRKRVTKSLSTL